MHIKKRGILLSNHGNKVNINFLILSDIKFTQLSPKYLYSWFT